MKHLIPYALVAFLLPVAPSIAEETEKPKEIVSSEELRARERAINTYLRYAKAALNTDGSRNEISNVLRSAYESMSWEHHQFRMKATVKEVENAQPKRFKRVSNRMADIFANAFYTDRDILLNFNKSALNSTYAVLHPEWWLSHRLTEKQRQDLSGNPYIICIVTHAHVQAVQLSRKTNESALNIDGTITQLDRYTERVGGDELRKAAHAMLDDDQRIGVIFSTNRCQTPREALKQYGYEFPPK